MGLLIKAVPGAAVVVLTGMLSKTKNYYLAGLIPLFPTFALIAHYFVVTGRGVEALRTTVIFGMWAIIPYFVCLASLRVPSGMVKVPLALGGAVACGCLSARLLIARWSRFH
ncbi:GlpM family protein [Cronobacter muytjensii]|uniref:GlpM family protein n=1 Tax=Cronobacter muytjensii TaxID=413501 RepID=UPI0034D6F1DB